MCVCRKQAKSSFLDEKAILHQARAWLGRKDNWCLVKEASNKRQLLYGFS